jgi:hypothetical protein
MKKNKIKKCLFEYGKKSDMKNKNCNSHGCNGGIYCLAVIGSLVYYIQNADSFWMGVLGVLKAIVWPAILVYKLLGFLG